MLSLEIQLIALAIFIISMKGAGTMAAISYVKHVIC